MAESIQIACPKDVYTALSSGQASVSFKPSGPFRGSLIIATSQPAPNATTFYPLVEGDFPVSLGNLSTNDKVYFKPLADVVANVLRG